MTQQFVDVIWYERPEAFWVINVNDSALLCTCYILLLAYVLNFVTLNMGSFVLIMSIIKLKRSECL